MGDELIVVVYLLGQELGDLQPDPRKIEIINEAMRGVYPYIGYPNMPKISTVEGLEHGEEK